MIESIFWQEKEVKALDQGLWDVIYCYADSYYYGYKKSSGLWDVIYCYVKSLKGFSSDYKKISFREYLKEIGLIEDD